MIFRHIFLLFLGLFVALPGRTQPQLDTSTLYQFPCSYSLSGASGSTGCYTQGTCNPRAINGPNFAVGSWYENWNCNSGVVSANGSSSIEYEYVLNTSDNTSYYYPIGIITNGSAQVTQYYPGGWQTNSSYNGYYGSDCEGGVQYSGAYDYTCYSSLVRFIVRR